MTTPKKSYKLTVTDTGSYSSGKYHYKVIDEAGNVITQRKSNRVYVACTIDGSYYFGRIDLVNKGGHGQQVRWCQENNRIPVPVAFIEKSL